MKQNRRLSIRLLIVALYLAGALGLLLCTRASAPWPEAAAMRDAAERAQTAFAALKDEKLERGYVLSPETDPNRTGLIGDFFTPITTTLGNLEAKRTSTNPNAAALVVHLLYEAGVRPGDRIAVNCSGSFPALNLSVLCAMDAMELDGTIFCSVGASTYGANLEGFTYPDMEHFLYTNGYLHHRSTAFSLGGENDQGLEFPAEIRQAICARLETFGYEYWDHADLEENIRSRLARYGSVGCFVNVGGNLVSTGGSTAFDSGSGLLQHAASREGLLGGYLEKGIPVLHFLNLKKLFPQYGLPVDPVPLPQAGEGALYQNSAANPRIAWVLLTGGVLLLLWAVKGQGTCPPL
ncbi:MAG: poly-gamma-glutamate system protein [Lawsonibacter sp.]|nr:poly-gamma-glutamate system protein [Lawsonibacter sp.]